MPIIDQTKGLRDRPHTFGRHETTKSAADLRAEAQTRIPVEPNRDRSVRAGGQSSSEAAPISFGGSGMTLGVRNTGLAENEGQLRSSFDTGKAHTARRDYLAPSEKTDVDADHLALNRLIYRDMLYNMVGTTGIADATATNLSFAQEYWGISYPDNDENNVADFPLSFRGAPDVANMSIGRRLLQNILSPYVPNLAPNSLDAYSIFTPISFPFGASDFPNPDRPDDPNTVAFDQLKASLPPGLANPSATSQYGTVGPKPTFEADGAVTIT